jgi:RNA polymerase sigma factor (sigma-70 family)
MQTPVSEAAHSAVIPRLEPTHSFGDLHKFYRGRIRAAAWRYRWSGADRDDLHQAGRVGLWRALGSFDSGRGAPFDAYATRAIYRAVRDEARRHATYASRLTDGGLGDADSESSCDPMDEFLGVSLDPEFEYDRELLNNTIERLPASTRRIYELRNHLGMTQAETAAVLGVTQQRASQIEQRLVTELRKALHITTDE